MGRVLIACEESQRVCIAFRKRGHEAYSCDVQKCSGGHPEWHIQGDVENHINRKWDLIIAHPPCTYLSAAGSPWFDESKYGEKARERKRCRYRGYLFVLNIAKARCRKICIENPTGWINTHSGDLLNTHKDWTKKPQITKAGMFGDVIDKRTCLWLKNLPYLKSINPVKANIERYVDKYGRTRNALWYANASSKARSKTFPGIASAMAEQWGVLIK